MNVNNSSNRKIKILYRVSTVLVAAVFFVTGFGNLIPIAHIARDMSHLGYPPYFLNILGTWKILGAIIIILPKVPRLKEWAYAGMIFDLTGAAASRLFAGDGPGMMIIPIGIAGVVAISCVLSRNVKAAVLAKGQQAL